MCSISLLREKFWPGMCQLPINSLSGSKWQAVSLPRKLPFGQPLHQPVQIASQPAGQPLNQPTWRTGGTSWLRLVQLKKKKKTYLQYFILHVFSVCIFCTSVVPQRTALSTVLFPVAAHLGTDRVLPWVLGVGRNGRRAGLESETATWQSDALPLNHLAVPNIAQVRFCRHSMKSSFQLPSYNLY